MLQKIEVSGIHSDLTKDIRDYAIKKIGSLDRFMPKHARDSAHADIHLSQRKSSDEDKFVCSVTVYLPQQALTIHEAASSFNSAIDLAEAKLKNQIHKYKELHSGNKTERHYESRALGTS